MGGKGRKLVRVSEGARRRDCTLEGAGSNTSSIFGLASYLCSSTVTSRVKENKAKSEQGTDTLHWSSQTQSCLISSSGHGINDAGDHRGLVSSKHIT